MITTHPKRSRSALLPKGNLDRFGYNVSCAGKIPFRCRGCRPEGVGAKPAGKHGASPHLPEGEGDGRGKRGKPSFLCHVLMPCAQLPGDDERRSAPSQGGAGVPGKRRSTTAPKGRPTGSTPKAGGCFTRAAAEGNRGKAKKGGLAPAEGREQSDPRCRRHSLTC